MTFSGQFDVNEQTVYIPVNGHREVIESDACQKMFRSLQKEGWKTMSSQIYPHCEDKRKDYITILLFKKIES